MCIDPAQGGNGPIFSLNRDGDLITNYFQCDAFYLRLPVDGEFSQDDVGRPPASPLRLNSSSKQNQKH